MKKNTRNTIIGSISILIVIALIIYLGWYFSHITIFIIIALIISLLANPLKLLLTKIHIGKSYISNGWASALALLLIIACIVGLVAAVAPTIDKQLNTLSHVNVNTLQHSYKEQLAQVDAFLHQYDIINQNECLETIIIDGVVSNIKKITPSKFFNNFIESIGILFLGIFSVLFIAFYILKDIPKLQNAIINMMPDKHQNETYHILSRSKKLLSNYFIGLAVEIVLVAMVEFALLSILKIENALLIAVLGGVLVIIPYIGSIVACVLGCIFAIMTAYIANPDIMIMEILLKVIGTFAFCRILDNFFLQPYIASKSVKAHPLEIFLVVLVSGHIAGIPGMMLGIPAYTILRIGCQEFFGNINFVKTLTRSLSDDTNTENSNPQQP